MRLFGVIDSAIGDEDRAFFVLMPPFDISSARATPLITISNTIGIRSTSVTKGVRTTSATKSVRGVAASVGLRE